MGKRAQRRREERDLARHVIENQIEPQMAIQRFEDAGLDVETVFVSTNPEAKGFTVTCTGCQRTATLSRDPGRKVGLCPACIKNTQF